MKHPIKALVLLLLLMLGFSISAFCNPDTGDNYWPKEAGRTSTLEAQGMDSERIYRMLKTMENLLTLSTELKWGNHSRKLQE